MDHIWMELYGWDVQVLGSGQVIIVKWAGIEGVISTPTGSDFFVPI